MALDPRNATALAHRAANLKAAAGSGAAEVGRALALEPKNTVALRVRAELSEAANRGDQAIPDYRQIVAADPSDQEAWAALERLAGERRAPPMLVSTSVLEGWQVFRRADGKFLARNDDFCQAGGAAGSFGRRRARADRLDDPQGFQGHRRAALHRWEDRGAGRQGRRRR